MKKWFLSLLLAVALLMAFVPAAFAVEHDASHTGFTALSEADFVNTYYLRSGTYYLAEDMPRGKGVFVAGGETVTLCLNGHTLDVGASNLSAIGTLNLCDCSSGEGKITTTGNVTVSIEAGGVANLYDCVLSNSQSQCIYNDGTCTISGGQYTTTLTYCAVFNCGTLRLQALRSSRVPIPIRRFACTKATPPSMGGTIRAMG